MNKLLNLIKWDIVFQAKYGLYLAGAILTVVWIGVLSMFSGEALKYAIPIVLISDVSTMGLLFISAIIFFEKGQGSINAVIATPVKTSDYITSKVISLSVFVSVFTVLLVIAIGIIKGISINYLFLVLAAALTGVFYILLGLYLTTFFKNFTDFLLPMGLVFGIFNLPIFAMFNLESLKNIKGLFYILPSHGLIKLFQGVFESQNMYDLVYAVIFNSLAIYILFRLCIKNFNTKIIGRTGDIDG